MAHVSGKHIELICFLFEMSFVTPPALDHLIDRLRVVGEENHDRLSGLIRERLTLGSKAQCCGVRCDGGARRKRTLPGA